MGGWIRKTKLGRYTHTDRLYKNAKVRSAVDIYGCKVEQLKSKYIILEIQF